MSTDRGLDGPEWTVMGALAALLLAAFLPWPAGGTPPGSSSDKVYATIEVCPPTGCPPVDRAAEAVAIASLPTGEPAVAPDAWQGGLSTAAVLLGLLAAAVWLIHRPRAVQPRWVTPVVLVGLLAALAVAVAGWWEALSVGESYATLAGVPGTAAPRMRGLYGGLAALLAGMAGVLVAALRPAARTQEPHPVVAGPADGTARWRRPEWLVLAAAVALPAISVLPWASYRAVTGCAGDCAGDVTAAIAWDSWLFTATVVVGMGACALWLLARAGRSVVPWAAPVVLGLLGTAGLLGWAQSRLSLVAGMPGLQTDVAADGAGYDLALLTLATAAAAVTVSVLLSGRRV